MLAFKILELSKVFEDKGAENAFLFNASPWNHWTEHSYWHYDIHYISDNAYSITAHLKIIVIDCPYLPSSAKALTQASVAVKGINPWNKHSP